MIARFLSISMILFAAAFLIPGEVYAGAGSVQLPKAKVGEDGLHKQDWFADSFLDLKEDVAEAKAANKRLVFIWEQKGCPYCERTHDINFRIPKIVDYIKANFTVIQLNMWGSREVTDFDGKISTEKELAQKWAIRFTPTVQFFPGDLKEIGNKNGQEAELLRVPGYFKPFHFYMLFQYVSTEAYKAEPNFQRYLIAEGTKLRDKGVDMDKQLWADELLFD